MTVDRTVGNGGHILISGTGRAGTTLLVQYFTALGFDTGHTPESSRAQVNEISNAGLEHTLSGRYGKRLPYVAKAPGFAQSIGQFLEEGRLEVAACIIPMRDLFAAAESRRRVARDAEARGVDAPPGALVFGARLNPMGQERRLAVQFHHLVHTLVSHGIPTYFLAFPQFALETDVLFARLEPLLAAHGVTREESRRALAAVCQPDLIHRFSDEPG